MTSRAEMQFMLKSVFCVGSNKFLSMSFEPNYAKATKIIPTPLSTKMIVGAVVFGDMNLVIIFVS